MSHEMPLYLQHKIVRAARIESVADDEADHITMTLSTGALVQESRTWYARMIGNLRKNPLVGCYYIRYPDGYTSVSPAAAFEAGCSLLEDMLEMTLVVTGPDTNGEYSLIMPGDLKPLEYPE